jgi:hypothetical protein
MREFALGEETRGAKVMRDVQQLFAEASANREPPGKILPNGLRLRKYEVKYGGSLSVQV